MSCKPVTVPSRCTKNDTSPSSAALPSGRFQPRSTCDCMFCRYSGNGKATPSVLMVATSLPVEGRSPGRGWFVDVVRGAASRRVLSCVGGGAARDTVLLRGGGLAEIGRAHV